MVRCELCGLVFQRITWKHLHFYHGISLNDYRREHPKVEIYDERSEELRCRAVSLGMRAYRARLTEEERKALGNKTSKGLNLYWVNLDTETYEKFRQQRSRQVTNYHDRMSLEEKLDFCRVNAESKQAYWDGLTEEQREERGRAVSEALVGKDLSGENNNHWKGGYVGYYGYGWGAIRERIWIRDNYTCQKCGTKEFTKNNPITCHHIDHDPDNMSSENLSTLCRSCNCQMNGIITSSFWEDLLRSKATKIW